MRAWLMDSYDGVDALRLAHVPNHGPGPGQILLRMTLAGLNPADAFLAQALYPARPPMPHVLGRDGVGEVIAVGAGVDAALVGQTVGILPGATGVETWGTLAEKTVISSEDTLPWPPGWSAEEMAGAPLVFLTAWQALTMWSDPPAPPPAGSVLLVTGASGGVGTASVLLGKALGLTVVALSRSREKGAKLTKLGADFVFDPADAGLRKAVGAAIAPRKVDLAIENVGGPLFNDVLALLGQGGRVSVVGRSAGVVPEFNSAALLFRRNRIGGVLVASNSRPEARSAWAEVVDRLQRTGARPVVDRVFAFDAVKEAFARLAEGPMGKVLVRC